MADDIESLIDGKGALLATVLDQTHDCIKLLSLDGIIRYVNRQGALSMELSSPTELLGESYLDRWPEEVRPILEKALADAREGNLARFTARRPQPSGLPSWWDVTVSPVRASSGEITHFVTISRDMTSEMLERERVEAISLEMRHRLKNAMTVAGGIVMASARGRPEARTFANEVIARLSQLASVHAGSLEPNADKRLADFVPMFTQAYGEDGQLVFGELPKVRLTENGMQALALCFGELATNSLKYGALRQGGSVRVDGTENDGRVTLSWLEDTIFGSPRAGGLGLDLVERLARTAGGSFERQITDGQMRALLTLPAA